jgi:tetraacyldisaccharide 4'-kinase
MEEYPTKINEWLLPLSWLYGLGVRLRNELFDLGLLKSKTFDIPVISVGNLTVGGTGKTPHTEYLIELLRHNFKVAVLSRGYKRKTHGFVLAGPDTTMEQIGDEPYQMKQKYPDICVAVDENRCEGIERLCDKSLALGVDVILLDDAFQHRYVTPGLSILLVDYHRPLCADRLLPAGRLREPEEGKRRANIVIATKCPPDSKPMDFRVINKSLSLQAFQRLYFTTITYGNLRLLFGSGAMPLDSIDAKGHVLLLTGIATPHQMESDLRRYTPHVQLLAFADHHYFTPQDVQSINSTFAAMEGTNKLIVTTEKDAARLHGLHGLSHEVKAALYVLPIRIKFLRNQQDYFNEKIISYVRKNSRNSSMAKSQNANTPRSSHHSGDRTGPSGLRD